MNYALLFLLAVVAVLWVAWILYGAVMTWMRARDAGTLTPTMKVLGYPVLWFGLLLDALINAVVCTVLFAELPREFLVTARLIRHKRTGAGWRFAVASWICSQLLDALDPAGCHCRTG